MSVTQKSKVFSWLLFDFANTSFSVIMVTFVFPLYFKNVICNGEPSGDALWGFSVSLSMLLVALISPVLGAAADYSGKRKRFLFVFTLISVVATALLSFAGPGMAVTAIALFILANIGFEGGLVFYDAYLKEIATDKSVGRVSGYGFAMGYLGALAILLLTKPLLSKGIVLSNAPNVQLSFLAASVFFALFSVPIFLALRDQKKKEGPAISFASLGSSIKEVKHTVRHIMNYPDLVRFLLAYFFYNDLSFFAFFTKASVAFVALILESFLWCLAKCKTSPFNLCLFFGFGSLLTCRAMFLAFLRMFAKAFFL